MALKLRRIVLLAAALASAVALCFFTGFWVVKAETTEFEGGNGSAESPFLVSNVQQLNAVHYDMNAFYKQINDIELSMPFTAIGTRDFPFMARIVMLYAVFFICRVFFYIYFAHINLFAFSIVFFPYPYPPADEDLSEKIALYMEKHNIKNMEDFFEMIHDDQAKKDGFDME